MKLSQGARLLFSLPAGCCRWPVGEFELDDPAFRWCGRIAQAGSSFCPGHFADSRDPDMKQFRVSWREPWARRV